MFAVEMVEGKDAPRLPPHPTNTLGWTVGLLLCLTEALYMTGKVVILDSRFCVLKGLIELRKKGVFASALVKKRRYWPAYVPGEAIDEKLRQKEVGECDSLRGEIDGVPYDIFGMKEPDYVMKIMSTYGGLIAPPDQQESVHMWEEGQEKRTKRFKYTEPFANHFKYRHSVDDHNNVRHGVPSLEGTWITKRWPLWVFSFILAVTEVNVFLAFRYFVWKDKDEVTFLQFRRRLAKALVMNQYLEKEEQEAQRSKRRKTRHEYCTAPTHAKKFSGGKWIRTNKHPYQQYWCRWPGCKKQTRNYCACYVGEWLCKAHYSTHVLEVATSP